MKYRTRVDRLNEFDTAHVRLRLLFNDSVLLEEMVRNKSPQKSLHAGLATETMSPRESAFMRRRE